MGTWFWLNIPLALLFVCCWAGIPMWLLLTRWHAEVEAKHAEVRESTPNSRHERSLSQSWPSQLRLRRRTKPQRPPCSPDRTRCVSLPAPLA